MSDEQVRETDWRIGDMALALRTLPPSRITAGQFLTVTGIVHGILELGLLFREVECPKEYRAFAASAFLKVTPPRKMIAEERKVEVPA